MDKKPKVLITLIENGMGHLVSIKAIEESLKQNYGHYFDITEQMVMDYKGDKDLRRMQNFLVHNVKLTNKHNWYGFAVFKLIKVLGGIHLSNFLNKTFFKSAFDKLVNELDESGADIIVSTHYWITSAALKLKQKKPNLVIINYNSENNCHIWWDNRADVFIVNNIHAKEEALTKRKFKPECVYQVPFVVRKDVIDFSQSREACRKKYNIAEDEFVVTLVDGAYASGKMEKMVKTFLKSNLHITLIALNEKKKKLLDRYTKNMDKVPSNIQFLPLGFTNVAYEIYKASDIVITKGGPNTILDCIYTRTPFIVSYYAHQIEKSATQIFAQEYGCGIKELNFNKLPVLISNFQNNSELLKPYIENSKKYFNNEHNGADEIAKILFQKAKDGNLI